MKEEAVKTQLFVPLVLIAAVIAAPLRADDVMEQIDKYIDLVKEGKNEADAKKIGEKILADEKDANNLNEFAWKILTEEGVKNRDVDLGMKVAKAAFDACEGKEAAIVDTYARAFFVAGKREEALKWQKKAIEICTDDNLKSELEETLKLYEKKPDEKK
jgi:hypothetical protein